MNEHEHPADGTDRAMEDLTDEEFADPANAEAELDRLALHEQLLAWGNANPLLVALPAARPKRMPFGSITWKAAASVALFVALVSGMGAVAYGERQARKRSELARDLLESNTKEEIVVRALVERARSRTREPRFGRVTETRQILLEAGGSLRAIADDKVVGELEFEIRSAFAATLPLFDVRPGERARLTTNALVLWPIAAHPDGKSLAIATTKGPVVWKRGTKLAGADALRPLSGCRLQYSPDGTYLAVLPPRGGLLLYDREATRVVADLEPEGKAVYLAIAFLPDGKTARACTADGKVRTWDVASSKRTEEAMLDVKGMQTLTAASFAPSGDRVLLGDEGGQVRLSPVDGKEGLRLPPMRGYIESLAFAPDGGRIAIGCRDGSVVILLVGGTPVLTLSGLDMAETLAFSPDGRWLMGGQRNNSGRLWDAQTGDGIQVGAAPVAVCGEGRTLAMTSTESVSFDELIVPDAIVHYAGHQGTPARLAWSGDGKNRTFATLDQGFVVRVWKVGQARPLMTVQMPRTNWFASNAGLALSKDGKYVAFASGGSAKSYARVVDVATGKAAGKDWELPGGYETLVAGEGDGFLLLREERAKGGGLRTVVYDLTPGKPAKAVRVLREAEAGDVGYFRAGATASGLYWWAGPRQPADERRVEVREIATGALKSKIAIRLEPDVHADAGGRKLWVREDAKTIRRFDLTRPEPGAREGRLPRFVTTDGKWAAYQHEGEKQALPEFVLERSGKPYVAVRGQTMPVYSFSRFGPDERHVSWGYTQDGVAVVADLPALEAAVDGFVRELRR